MLSALLTVLQPLALKLLIDGALVPTEEVTALVADFGVEPRAQLLIAAAAIAGLTLYLLRALVDLGLSWAWVTAGQRMVVELSVDLFDRYLRLSPRFHARSSVGDALNRLGADTYAVYIIVESLLISPAQQLLTLVLVGIVAWRLDPGLTLIALVVAPLMAATTRFFGPRLKQRARDQRETQSRLQGFVHQTLVSLPVVQSFATADRNSGHFGQLAEDVVGATRRSTIAQHAAGGAQGLIISSCAAVVLTLAGQRVLAGTLSIGSLLVITSYLRSLKAAFSNLFGVWARLKTVEASLDRLADVFCSGDEVRDPPKPLPLPVRQTGHGVALGLEGVRFAYETDHEVLAGIDLQIEAGETVAIVGTTGGGNEHPARAAGASHGSNGW